MNIYNIIFGQDYGQVNCCFHDDSRASAGIGPNGEYNCFACSAKAHNSTGFIMKYFQVSEKKAIEMRNKFNKTLSYRYLPITDEQRNFLHSVGLIDRVIDRFFFRSGQGKLMQRLLPNANTWWNAQGLSNHFVGHPKYKYDFTIHGGMTIPFDNMHNNHIIITEGEKDMLTLLSLGIPNVVAKIGGVQTRVLGNWNFKDKNVTIIYDCDDPGREGAIADADYLTEKFNCKVKVVDLGLKDKEDLNDYFIVYGKSIQDLQSLMAKTSIHTVTPKAIKTKVQTIIDSLTADEKVEIIKLLKEENNG